MPRAKCCTRNSKSSFQRSPPDEENGAKLIEGLRVLDSLFVSIMALIAHHLGY